MRRKTRFLLPFVGMTLAFASPAAAQMAGALGGIGMGVLDSEGSACAAATADSEHERWIDLLSVGSAIERQARSGGPGRIIIEAGDEKSIQAISALARCGGALELALGDGRRKYHLSGVSIRQNEPRRTLSSDSRNLRSEISTFTLTFEAVQRAD